MNNIEKSIKFLKDTFEDCKFFKENESSKLYRIEHSIRVANIGKQIAIEENLDVEALVIGCILHDIGYAQEFTSDDDYVNHGRYSAKLARPFLKSLGYDESKVDEICYGIAIHVDDKADFDGERTPLALSIGDSDNIDRFDAFRIYMDFENRNFSDMLIDDKMILLNNSIDKLKKYMIMDFGTRTGLDMWQDKIKYRIEYSEKLKSQFENSKKVNIVG
ncbi:HD domain-containing protein [Sedimentibacter sp. zth1]|uniref:HD domain-containing protein n=1 Tax=Sedimentibacter sp. zth1 TaxID=2816908 RepID=UPI001A919688|nr:HD domain-containing protein [Sedimentibacter sp. zth1]QSX06489.1 HD domain-containing protein [Sedimentibacter sp. zth1]